MNFSINEKLSQSNNHQCSTRPNFFQEINYQVENPQVKNFSAQEQPSTSKFSPENSSLISPLNEYSKF